jgi:bifunctional DNA-binding transcriptional regulator/antitoxin component of YhaV-PrlF toxin-antitoxin module
MLTSHPLEAVARLRAKNQLTLPEPIAAALEVHPDDQLLFAADPDQPDVFTVRRVPTDWAGALTGVFGTTEEVKAFLHEEHQAWGE